jgi:nucleotide-binding universal stress UspA family protein
VVGVDGSSAAERALGWAMDEATLRGCPVHVVNAWDYEPLADWAETGEHEARARSEALVETALRSAVVGRREFPEIVRHCLRGNADDVLEATARGAALLVVGSHAGHRLRDIVLGSTSAQCVLRSTVPVVVVPAREAPKDLLVGAAAEAANR